jgi:hypothetical protein
LQKIEEITRLWNSAAGAYEDVTVKVKEDTTLPVKIPNVNPGTVIVFSEISENDIILEVWQDDQIVESSKIHTSCSDDLVNGHEDIGNLIGAGKGNNDDKYDAVWILQGFIDGTGQVYEEGDVPCDDGDDGDNGDDGGNLEVIQFYDDIANGGNGNGYIDKEELMNGISDYLTPPPGSLISKPDLIILIIDFLEHLP